MARPGDRITCARQVDDPTDFKTLAVCFEAFWRVPAGRRRYTNVIRALRRAFDALDVEDGRIPDPHNVAVAREWVDHALRAKGSPLGVIPRDRS